MYRCCLALRSFFAKVKVFCFFWSTFSACPWASFYGRVTPEIAGYCNKHFSDYFYRIFLVRIFKLYIMAGHSKWSTIKRKKGAIDAKRSKEFSRIVKEITVAVKEGGSNPESNSRLRVAINNAKGVNMPKDNVQRAINKAEKEDSNLQEITFEGYGPEGIPIFVECLTDNNNRTVGSVRATFTKRGGSLGTNGSLSFMFDRKGVFTILREKVKMDPEELELELIDAGLDEIEVEEETLVLYCPMTEFGALQRKLDDMHIEVENAELQRIPNDYKVLDPESAMKVLKFIEDLEDNDDVQNVYHNLEMTDELQKVLEENS